MSIKQIDLIFDNCEFHVYAASHANNDYMQITTNNGSLVVEDLQSSGINPMRHLVADHSYVMGDQWYRKLCEENAFKEYIKGAIARHYMNALVLASSNYLNEEMIARDRFNLKSRMEKKYYEHS